MQTLPAIRGCPALAWASFSTGGFAYRQGTPGDFASSDSGRRKFCMHCGTPIAPTRDAFNIEGSPTWTVTASRLTHATPRRPDDPSSLGDFEREHYLVISVLLNIVFFANADGWGWLSVLPQSAGRTLICEGGRFTEHEDGPGAAEFKSYERVREEDRILCERIQ